MTVAVKPRNLRGDAIGQGGPNCILACALQGAFL